MNRLDELIAELRDECLQLQKLAWGRMDGGQDCSLSANLADEAADELARLRGGIYNAITRLNNAEHLNEGPGCPTCSVMIELAELIEGTATKIEKDAQIGAGTRAGQTAKHCRHGNYWDENCEGCGRLFGGLGMPGA